MPGLPGDPNRLDGRGAQRVDDAHHADELQPPDEGHRVGDDLGLVTGRIAHGERDDAQALLRHLAVGVEDRVQEADDRHDPLGSHRFRAPVEHDVGAPLDQFEQARTLVGGDVVEGGHELEAESNGTSATRGYSRRVSSASTPSLAASTTRAASVGSPITSPASDTVASLHRHSP